jgi:hypothetical protein
MRVLLGERHGPFLTVAVLLRTVELVAFRVVLEDLSVNLVDGGRFKVHAFLVPARFPKKRGQPEAQQQCDDYLAPR